MQTISGILADELPRRFPDRAIRLALEEKPFAVIAAAHPAFGDIRIWDDGYEATVEIGRHTHFHAGCWDESLDEAARRRIIADDVLAWLDRLFADRIVVWSREKSGGCCERELFDPVKTRAELALVWSGPLTL